MRAPLFLPLVFLTLGGLLHAQDIVLPDGKAKSLVQDTCTECHGLETVVATGMSSTEWRDTVKQMVRRGAALKPDQIDTVVDYLSVYFGAEKINVNTASAQELQNALKVTAEQAAAIVAYRKANGNFKDLDGLKKVTGLDAAKLDAKKDSIGF
jgi:competence protein ComEA